MGDCICPHAVKSLGTLYGVSMGTGRVRTGTTKGCPIHDTCAACGTPERRCYQQRWSKGFARMEPPCCSRCSHLSAAALAAEFGSTHTLGVLCAVCKGVLVADDCCGRGHGSTFQERSEWAVRTWPDHGCFKGWEFPAPTKGGAS